MKQRKDSRKDSKGSSMVEYLVIVVALVALVWGGVPAIRDMLELHHDQAVNTLSIPN